MDKILNGVRLKLKYRGVCVSDGRIAYGDLLHDQYGVEYISGGLTSHRGVPLSTYQPVSAERIKKGTLSEYVRDNEDGEPIYTGDLIEDPSDDPAWRSPTPFVVGRNEYGDFRLLKEVELPSGKKDMASVGRIHPHHKVIGNKFGNPELLK